MSRQLCYFYIEPNSLIHKETMWLLVLVDSKGNITQPPSYDQDCFLLLLVVLFPSCLNLSVHGYWIVQRRQRPISRPSHIDFTSTIPTTVFCHKQCRSLPHLMEQVDNRLKILKTTAGVDTFFIIIKIPLKVETIYPMDIYLPLSRPLADRSCVV